MHPLRLLSSFCAGATIAVALPLASFSAEAPTAVSADVEANATGGKSSEEPDGRKVNAPLEPMVGPAVLVNGRPGTKTPEKTDASGEPTASAEMPSTPSDVPAFDDNGPEAEKASHGRVARWFREASDLPPSTGIIALAGTTISGGTLTMVANDTLTGPVTITSTGTLNLNSTSQNIGSTLTVQSGGTITDTGGGGSITATGYDFDTPAAGRTISVVLGGTATLKSSVTSQLFASNTLTLSGLNTYQGATSITSGTLSINSIGNVGGGPSALGAPTTAQNGTITLGFGAGLRYTGPGATTDRIISINGQYPIDGSEPSPIVIDGSGTGPLIFTSAVNMPANAYNLILTGSALGNALAGSIPDNTSYTYTTLIKDGPGSWTLSAPNTYVNGTTILDGLLRLSGSGTLGSQVVYTTGMIGTLTINGGTLDLGGTFQAVGSFNGTGGTVVNDATGTQATLSVGMGNPSHYHGIIADHTVGTGTVAIVKVNPSTVQTFSGANTYSGGTTITGTLIAAGNNALGTGLARINSDGILSVNGVTLSNPITIGGTMNGSGTTSGALTLLAGGILAPGPSTISGVPANNVGAFTVSSFTWDGGGVMNFTLLGASNSDSLAINGAFIMGSPGPLLFDFQNGGTVFQNYPLLTFNSLVGFTPGDASAFSYTHLTGGLTGSFTLTPTGLFFSTIPEPSTYAAILGGCALAGAIWYRRRLKVK